MKEFRIGNRVINIDTPPYFIADIASNHGGKLSIAKELIYQAAEAGADAAKFQHFRAETLVSKIQDKHTSGKLAHQTTWSKSAFETYRDFEIPLDWSEVLSKTAFECGIDYFTSPYDLDIIDSVAPFVPVFKVGSGDITWIESIRKMATFGKPIIFATGASNQLDVDRVVVELEKANVPFCVMQCNTNYTGNVQNLKFLNLNVLKEYAKRYPGTVLGLSDHTEGHVSVLGAITLGARVIEKHFALEKSPLNPDKKFSLIPSAWAKMVSQSRDLYYALGDGIKRVEINEIEAQVAQRRCLRYRKNLKKDHLLTLEDLVPLRPAPKNSLSPIEADLIIGKKLVTDVTEHEVAMYSHVEMIQDAF